jgi:hypothetical protein
MPINGYVINGGKRASFYAVSVGASQTTLTSTTAVYTCTSQITSDGAKDDSGVTTWTIEQIQADSDFWSFIDTYAPSTAQVSTSEELTMEDGEIISGQVTGGTTLAMVVKGSTVVSSTGTENGKRLIWAGLVKVAKSSGSVNFAGTAYVKPTLSAVASSITQDLVIPSAVFTDFQTKTPASVTIAATVSPYGKIIVQ